MTNKLFQLYVTEERQRLCVLRHFDSERLTFFTEEDVAEMMRIVRGGNDGSEIIRAVSTEP